MAAYIVVPVIVLTMIAIWLMVFLYDRRFKHSLSSLQTSRSATTSTNLRQEGIVYTISNTPTGSAHQNLDANNATHIRIGPDGRGAPPQYTNQNLIVVAIPKDMPPTYDQATGTREETQQRV